MIFFDASAAAKWFLAGEEHADEVDRLRGTEGGAVSRFTEVELVSALARRQREGSIGMETLQRLLAACAEELESVVVLEVDPSVVDLARSLLLRHPLRAGDALQLSSCLVLQERLRRPVLFLAFDRRLNDAAQREGLRLPWPEPGSLSDDRAVPSTRPAAVSASLPSATTPSLHAGDALSGQLRAGGRRRSTGRVRRSVVFRSREQGDQLSGFV